MVKESHHTTTPPQAGINGINAADVLTCITKSMDDDFSGHFDPVVDFARHIPAYSGNMLELHFDRAAWFDYAFRSNIQFDKPLLQEAHLPACPPFVGQVHRLLMNEDSTAFRYGIENICFEYDFPFQTAPSVFFDIHRTAGLSLEKKYEELERIADGLQYFLPADLFAFIMKIRRSHLNILYFGCMLSRKSRSVRLTIHGIEPAALIPTLRDIGWRGDEDVLTGLQRTYLHPGQKIVLGIDFQAQLQNRIGIEVFDANEGILLKKLHTNGMIGKQQYGFLQEWPGSVAPDPCISAALTRLHLRAVDCMFKRINHVKFTIDDQSVSAKAYLYYCF